MSALKAVPDLPPCDSPIWGHGELIDTVQRARLFHDSKTFVDLKLLHDPLIVVSNFQTLEGYPAPSNATLRQFVTDNFSMQPNQEFEEWEPEDWVKYPGYLSKLRQKPLIYVGLEVNKLWRVLSQKCSKELRENPNRFSLFPLPNGFVMPGGRFREIYYWDTFYIILGLLASQMHKTVRGILGNFVHQIKLFGHIPNGTRAYYIRRSQPPFLISMFAKYLEATDNFEYLEDNIEHLEKELVFYEEQRCKEYTWTNGKTYKAFHFSANCRGPRPESYSEDVVIADSLFGKEDHERKEELYLHLKAAAESGWDFSSRWFIDPEGGNTGTLANAKTAYILPVDINALMYKNYAHMMEFFTQLDQPQKVEEYKAKAENMLTMMAELFWDPSENMWFDIDTINNKRRCFFYASNLFPLWAGAYPKDQSEEIGRCAVNYLVRTGATRNTGGIPASLKHSGQQWDFNVWPPLEHMIVCGLNQTGNLEAKKLAFQIAKDYSLDTIKSCNKASDHCEIFEKYDPTNPGSAGQGGEYEVQVGFGWSNGVLVDFIMQYGDDLIECDEYVPKAAVEAEVGKKLSKESVEGSGNKAIKAALNTVRK